MNKKFKFSYFNPVFIQCVVFFTNIWLVSTEIQVLPSVNRAQENFKRFSHDLLLKSDLDEFTVEKGASISSPFGVAYMLANIEQSAWNVSLAGIVESLRTNDTTETEYAKLLTQLNNNNVSTSSTIYTKDKNLNSTEGSQILKTETKYINYVENWPSAWEAMNAKITNESHGKLNEQLIPRGGWWGGAFYHFTAGAFVNTMHFKSSWKTNWTNVGVKRFHDGLSIPFFEVEEYFPYVSNNIYEALSIPLKNGNKSLVLVLPRKKIASFLRDDLADLINNPSPQSWNHTEKLRVSLPAINITLLDQHFRKLELMGVNNGTFCKPEPPGYMRAQMKGYFLTPIVQAHHIEFSSDSLEIATATGTSISSEEDLNQKFEPQLDLSEVPPEILAEADEEPEDLMTSILPKMAEIESILEDETILSALFPSDVLNATKREVDQMIEQALELAVQNISITTSTTPQPTLKMNVTTETTVITTENANSSIHEPTKKSAPDHRKLTEVVTVTTENNSSEGLADKTTTVIDTSTKGGKNSHTTRQITFDSPFIWYVYDEQMGFLQFGSVNSLATYRKEYGIEDEEDAWLFDAYKTLLWNCP